MREADFSKQRRQFIAYSAAAVAGSTCLFQTYKALAQNQRQYGIKGKLAPELSLDYWIDKDGTPAEFSVINNRGKWILLKCFQDWCPGCHSSGFPTLKKFSDVFWDHPKVAIAGIQTVFEGFFANTQDDVRKLQVRYGLSITMGHDPGNPSEGKAPQTMRKYRTGGTPWLILIAPDGYVIFDNYHVNTDKLIAFVQEQVG